MKNNEFRNTERKLYNYFDKDNLIHSYNNKIEYLKQKIVRLQDRLKNTDININVDIKAISYEERVQCSSEVASYAEKTLMSMVDLMGKEICDTEREIWELEMRIEKLKSDNRIIGENLNTLKNDYIKFIKYKYKEKSSNKSIALKMCMSEASITRLKHQALKLIENWEGSLFI